MIKTTVRFSDETFELLSAKVGSPGISSIADIIRQIVDEWATKKDASSESESKTVDDRCSFRHVATGVQCCLPSGHEKYHRYKCSGQYCPGLPWVASQTAHPRTCCTGNDSIEISISEIKQQTETDR